MLRNVAPHCRSASLPALLLVAFLSGLIPAAAFGQKKSATDGEIQTALKRAIASLKPKVNTMDDGQSALITMALLKAGVKPDSAEIQVGIERILKRVSYSEYKPGIHWVYEAGVSLLALANADPVKFKPQIATIARFLIDQQQPAGFWDYRNATNGDTSISQYAILGLWEAQRAGVQVPKKVWDRAAGWHIRHQTSDGGFYYHPGPDSTPGVLAADMLMTKPTHSMTAAGTASLCVARLHLYPDARDTDAPVATSRSGRKRGKKYGILEPAVHVREEAPQVARAAQVDDASYKRVTRLSAIDAAISRGKTWFANRFTVEPREQWDIYYLYGLERLSALANTEEYGGHDWYQEGAAHLCATQDVSGGWRDGCGNDPATAFGVLFLTRATAKMLVRKERRLPERRYGGGLLIGGRGLPENLASLEVDQNGVRVRKLNGPVDELLAELENAQSQKIESAQEALVETIATQDPEALVGQTERLLRLVGDKRPEVRRTVYWALGRTDDLRVVPTLIKGLADANLDCMVEARNALRFISKKIDVVEPPDEPTDAQRHAAIALWKKWYLGVRPYDERDDLGEPPVK